MLMDLGHESPIENVSFTFGIEGIRRSLLTQITRNRIASFSVKSLAIEIVKLAKKVAPILFKFAGPKCLLGSCLEGKMSCGESKKVRQEFMTME